MHERLSCPTALSAPASKPRRSSVYVLNTQVDANSMTSKGGTKVFFESGGDFDCVSTCGASHYGKCVAVDSCFSCEIDVCYRCAPGKFAKYGLRVGGTLEDDTCQLTSTGYYTNKTASVEEYLCPPGSYVTDTEDDDDGFGVTLGGTFCNPW